jgi:hypothetical protein
MTEATWWRFKAFAAWVGVIITGLLGYLHGFALLSHYLASQDAVHLAANIYLYCLPGPERAAVN